MDREEKIKRMYLDGFSSIEIAEKVEKVEKVLISPRQIQRIISRLGIMRDPSKRFINAISRGRMVYTKKPEEQRIKRKGLTVKARYTTLSKYGFRCCLCGITAKDGRIEIDHIDGNASNNEASNLQVLCDNCNKGKYRYTLI